MILFNIAGGPSVGKTVFATNLFAQLKIAGFQTELAREKARDFIYAGSAIILKTNQFLVTGVQYEEVLKVARCGFEVAVSESPLILGAVYGRMNGLDYADELESLVKRLEGHFETYNVLLRRCRPYMQEARVHTEAEALEADRIIRDVIKDVWLEIDADDAGFETLKHNAVKLLQGRLR
jgi:TPP-dependent pyruvate/acetoin dehydrogenase alpha subunit